MGFLWVVRALYGALGFRPLIAVHDTTLGPALGGLRMWNYASDEEALTDVLRLARGMTYKSAVARTPMGGGKSVVIADSHSDKTEGLFHCMGRFIDSLNGTYFTAEDVGINVYDLDLIAQETRFVTGRSREVGGSGDPSPYTALGTFLSTKVSLQEVHGDPDPAGRTVALQGLGHVGYWLAKHLHEAGAKLVVADLDEGRVRRAQDEFGASVLSVDEILGAECDVLAPCALGAILNDRTIPQLRTRVICGPANNQLGELRHAEDLQRRGILYAPDYVVNAGGILNISVELDSEGYDDRRATDRVHTIVPALEEVLEYARTENVTTAQAAEEVAEKVLSKARAAAAG